MIDIDIENERMVKEYIEGNTIFDMVKNDISVEQYLSQVRKMAALAKSANLNQKNVTLINIKLLKPKLFTPVPDNRLNTRKTLDKMKNGLSPKR